MCRISMVRCANQPRDNGAFRAFASVPSPTISPEVRSTHPTAGAEERCGLQRPASAIMPADISIRLRVVGNFHLGAVPEQLAVGITDGQVPHKHHFRERTGVVEVRAGRLASLACADPVLLVSLFSARDSL